MKTQLPQPPAAEEAAAREFDRRVNAVTAAYDRHDPLLRAYAASKIASPEDVKDFQQEFWRHILLQAPLEKIDHLPWLLRKSRWRIGDYHRSRKRLSEREVPAGPVEEIADRTASFREPENSPEAEARLREQFFENFPDLDLIQPQRDVLWLYARQGLTLEEISTRMNLPSSTVHDWISKARKQLRPYLES